MRAYAVFGVVTVALSACRTGPEPSETAAGYKGIEKIQILAKGME